ncbi:MAG TPA: MoaD/ThiS family protein [Ktedonobacteraceae bacterium]|nr:MoaD/ThiS family protein [Ktedonobacteraceae bacterium]
MQVNVALFGTARVVTGKARVDIALDGPSGSRTLGQVLEALCATYPRARPYLLTEAGALQSHIRVLINDARPQPDATLSTPMHDGDRVTLLVAVAGGCFPFFLPS